MSRPAELVSVMCAARVVLRDDPNNPAITPLRYGGWVTSKDDAIRVLYESETGRSAEPRYAAGTLAGRQWSYGIRRKGSPWTKAERAQVIADSEENAIRNAWYAADCPPFCERSGTDSLSANCGCSACSVVSA